MQARNCEAAVARQVRGLFWRAALWTATLGAVISAAACGGATAASPSPSITAASTPHKQAQRLAKGTVTAVSASSLTVVTAAGATKTFALAPDVTVKEGSHQVALSAVTPGEAVVLYAAANGSSTETGGTALVGKIVIKTPARGPTPTSVS